MRFRELPSRLQVYLAAHAIILIPLVYLISCMPSPGNWALTGALLLASVLFASWRVELTVLDGNDAARRLYEAAGFVVEETRTGPLVGNEAFTATGHIMFRDPVKAS